MMRATGAAIFKDKKGSLGMALENSEKRGNDMSRTENNT